MEICAEEMHLLPGHEDIGMNRQIMIQRRGAAFGRTHYEEVRLSIHNNRLPRLGGRSFFLSVITAADYPRPTLFSQALRAGNNSADGLENSPNIDDK
jgi:hypothetical protein